MFISLFTKYFVAFLAHTGTPRFTNSVRPLNTVNKIGPKRELKILLTVSPKTAEFFKFVYYLMNNLQNFSESSKLAYQLIIIHVENESHH